MAAEVEIVMMIGSHRHVWCPDCLSTSRIEAEMHRLSSAGVTWVKTVTHCPRCSDHREES